MRGLPGRAERRSQYGLSDPICLINLPLLLTVEPAAAPVLALELVAVPLARDRSL